MVIGLGDGSIPHSDVWVGRVKIIICLVRVLLSLSLSSIPSYCRCHSQATARFNLKTIAHHVLTTHGVNIRW